MKARRLCGILFASLLGASPLAAQGWFSFDGGDLKLLTVRSTQPGWGVTGVYLDGLTRSTRDTGGLSTPFLLSLQCIQAECPPDATPDPDGLHGDIPDTGWGFGGGDDWFSFTRADPVASLSSWFWDPIYWHYGSVEWSYASSRMTFAPLATSTAPEPGSVALLATGLVGLGVVAWRKRQGTV